jgi:capsular exopolysaccharide synthesis family protein
VDVDSTIETMTAEDLLDRPILSYLFPRPYVDASQYEETDIIEIETISTDPEQARNLSNAVAQAFIDEELKRIREDFRGARTFIGQTIAKSREEYIRKLDALRDFKEREKTVNLDSETANFITRISDLEKSMETTRLGLLQGRAAVDNIESQLKRMPKYQKDSEQIKANDMILSLKQTLRDQYISLAETKTKYKKDHPNVVDIENKIAETRDLMRKEMEKVFSSETISLDPVYRDLTGKAASGYAEMAGFEAQDAAYPIVIRKYKAEMMSIPAKSHEYAQLTLSVTVTQDIYNSLLKSLYQVGIAESIAVSNVYLVETAVAPKRDDSRHLHPSRSINGIIGFLLGVFFGIGAAIVVEYMDDTIKTSDDVKAYKGITYLGSIRKLRKKEPRGIHEIDPRSPLREAFRTIRNSVRFATLDSAARTYAVTSTVQGEGKSFLVGNLAISLASEGKRVLIVDGDMRQPYMHTMFGISNSNGITNCLAGDSDIADIVTSTGIENLRVIPTGPIPPDPARLIESKKMLDLMERAKEQFDIVIIDTPPVLAANDAISLSAHTDGLIMVIESGKAGKKQFRDVLDLLRKMNVNIVGAVLNKVSERDTGYNYYSHVDKSHS